MQHTRRKFQVKRAVLGKGLGLFAVEPIKKGEFIVEYTGRKITTTEANQLTTKYLFEIDDKITIDGAVRNNVARYANHSCKPNVEVEIENGKINLYAKKNINQGEKLVYDYGKEYFDMFIKPHGCKCASCAVTKAK